MYVEEIKTKRKNKTYTTVLIRETFRESGRIRHRTLANISKLPPAVILQVKQALAGKGQVCLDELCINSSKEFGGSFAFLELAKDIGFDRIIYSRSDPWRQNALAMIVGRILWQGSKLSLTNMYKDSSLWELCGHDAESRPDVQKDCYDVLDKLLDRQNAIQKKLSEKHLDDGCLVLYDITNTWLEGEYSDSKLAAYGLGKGGKRGYKQIAIGLITNRIGCPVAIEVFCGNTSDQSTVWGQAQKLADAYGVRDVILAGDRGMLTPKRIEEVERLGFKTLTALTHPQMSKMLEKCDIEPSLFDEKEIIEIVDSDEKCLRYMLCKNPETMRSETATRLSLIDAAVTRLNDIAKVKRKRDPQKVCARIGRVFAKYRIEKFFTWKVEESGSLHFSLNNDVIDTEQALDGCYVIRADISRDILNKEEAVAGYMALRHVEKAFRNLKTVALEMRPIYHKTDARIRAHIFLCFLSYYLLWHAQQRLKPLFDKDDKGSKRRWSVAVVIERLKSLRRNQLLVEGIAVRKICTKPDKEQAEILDLLGVNFL
ncbi:MAG: IS1634 family transposase [Deltaproteobacteria bacterium]|nr:MAG: IS1634 family transposase [Deltaproteobacteria bacterium]